MKKLVSLLLAIMMTLSVMSFAAAEDAPVEINVAAVVSATTKELETIPMFQEIEKKANVKINWTYYTNDWSTIKNTMFASGDLPDVFFGRSALSIDDIQRNLDYFVALDEYIEQYCPNIQRMWEEYPDTKRVNTLSDGHTYSVGHVMAGRPDTFATLYINQLWLDKVNMEVPTTIEELTDVLRAFKAAGDINGNGEADEILFTNPGPDSANFGTRAFLGSFGVNDSLDSWLALDDNGKVIYNPATENFKAYLNWCHTLYSEGLMDQECLTQDWSQFTAKNASTEVGLRVEWDITGFPNGDDYALLLPLEGPDGYRLIAANTTYNKLGTDNYNVASITTANENIEATMRWLDLFYSDEYGIQSYYGSYGEGLVHNEDGTISRAEPGEGYVLDTWAWVVAMNDGFVGYVSKDVESKLVFNDEFSLAGTSKLHVDAAYKPYTDQSHNFPKLNVDSSLSDELSLLATDIESVRTTFQAQWIANGGIDEQWDSYLAELNNAGLTRYLEIYQQTYDQAMGR